MIQVTQRHIDNGVPKSCTKCPVALGLRDTRINAFVHSNYAHWGDEDRYFGDALVDWIARFDANEPVEPIIIRDDGTTLEIVA